MMFHRALLAAAMSAALLGAAQAQDVIRIGGTANYGPVLPVKAAEKLGLFEKAGVKMQFTNFAGGAQSMEGLAAGEADLINYFPPGLALAKARGVKATIVGASTTTPRGWAIMVAKDSPITDIKQLVGKKVGVTTNGATTDFFALWAAKQAGGAITRVPLGGGGLVPGLLAGNVEAISTYPPLTYRLALGGQARILVDLGSAMSANLPDVWIASDEVINKKPEALRRALVALYSAIKYMQDNPDWTLKLLEEQAQLTPDIAKEEFKQTIMGLSSTGTLKEADVAASLELGSLAGNVKMPDPKSLFTDKFVPVQTISP
jgi:NitT/TauT family transport system substrate-binding protein